MISLIQHAGFVWHRMWSMRFMLLTTGYTAAAGAWAAIPEDWKPELSHPEKMVLAGIGVLLPMLASLSAVVDQPKLRAKVAAKAAGEAPHER